jgi:hypothetical protein
MVDGPMALPFGPSKSMFLLFFLLLFFLFFLVAVSVRAGVDFKRHKFFFLAYECERERGVARRLYICMLFVLLIGYDMMLQI